MLTRAFDILYLAKQDGIDIVLNENQLQLKFPKNKDIDKTLLEEIKENKEQIIDFLKSHQRDAKTYNRINRFNRDSDHCIPLSFGQERLWFIDQLEGSVHYHRPNVLRLKGKLDKDALKDAFRTIVNRHEILRTVILEAEGKPYQAIKDKDTWQLTVIEGSQYQRDFEELQRYIDKLVNQPFNLSKADMLRVVLMVLDKEEHVLVMTMHHVVSDGWSESIFINELSEAYNAYIENRPVQLRPLEIQYADFTLWQRAYLQGELLDKKIAYWKEKLQGVTPLQLPTDYPRPSVQKKSGAIINFHIDKEISESLQQLGQEQGTTLFMVLLTAFKVLLCRFTSQEDICVGIPIAGRQQQEVEGLIGFFVNTLALRSEVSGDASFIELLQQEKTTILEAYEHQEVPFEKVVEAVVKERDISRSPLFQVMLVVGNTRHMPELHLGDVKVSPEPFSHNTAKFDLTLSITETTLGLEGAMEYSTDLFTERTINSLLGHLKELFSSIVMTPHQKIGTLKILTKAEEQQLLVGFNNTTVDYPKDISIVALFEERVTKTPDAIAVIFEQEHLSYRQLNERANQLAHYLKSRGVHRGNNIGLLSFRKIEMLISMLGILKAGAVYVPFNTEYPNARLKYIIEDAAITHVVYTDNEILNLFQLGECEYINFNQSFTCSIQSPDIDVGIDSPVYIMYTSGTTGRPRGISVSNRNIIKLVYEPGEIAVKPDDRMLQWSNYAFDGSVYEIFSSLLKGGELCLIKDNWVSDVYELSRVIREQKITVCFITTALFNAFIDIDPIALKGLRKILFGGEMVSSDHVRKAFSVVGAGKIVHVYGPTETTVYATYFPVEKISEEEIIPIGKPLANTKLFVLNKYKQLVPIGVPGELYIGGEGVSLGYVNNEVLTEEKFIANPFCKESVSKIYKTGDLVKYLGDGNIEFLGRSDDQVKIRGYRIELSEIESVLQQSQLIKGAVVLAKDDGSGNKRLIGYIVPEGDFDREAITSYVKGKLPGYMVPAQWVEIERLPLTPNGKIDKKALPEPDSTNLFDDKYVAPKTEAEKIIADIWKELLHLEQVGIKDNFFELGGHSLVVLQLVNRVRKLGVNIEARDFFANQTIEQQSTFIATSLKLLQSASNGKFVMPIQTEGDHIPLFAFPEFLLYSRIGDHISKKQPFYAIERSPFEKVEDVVAHYISELKKIYPHGPYCLAGYCQWGKIAVEMAHTLLAQGEEVPLLILIEYYSQKTRRSRASFTFLLSKLKVIYNRLKSNPSFRSKGKIISTELYYTFYYILKKQFLINRSNGKNAKPYPGKVVLIQASETYNFKEDSHMGWSEVFIGDVQKFTIQGEHLGIFLEPGASDIAEKLNLVLEKTNENYRDRHA